MFATAFLSMALSVVPGPGGIAESGHVSLTAETGYPWESLDVHVGILARLELWGGMAASTVNLLEGANNRSTFFEPHAGARVRVVGIGGASLLLSAEGA